MAPFCAFAPAGAPGAGGGGEERAGHVADAEISDDERLRVWIGIVRSIALFFLVGDNHGRWFDASAEQVEIRKVTEALPSTDLRHA